MCKQAWDAAEDDEIEDWDPADDDETEDETVPVEEPMSGLQKQLQICEPIRLLGRLLAWTQTRCRKTVGRSRSSRPTTAGGC